MKVLLSLASFLFICAVSKAQQFNVISQIETIQTSIGKTLSIPIQLQNNDSKALVLVIKKIESNLGSTQKTSYCINKICTDARIEEQTIRLEPYQLVTDFFISLDAGLARGESSIRYAAYNKLNVSEVIEFELNFTVDEEERQSIYDSKFITLHDVYPNPAVETTQIDYKIHHKQPTYSIIVRNLLGNIVSNYKLNLSDTKLKMRTDDLNAGIYFFTLYIDNEGVMTRKMIVKK